MKEFLLSLTSGIVSGILVYVFILYSNLRNKANIKISDKIAKTTSNSYKIKIVNKAKFDVVDVRAELASINFYKVPNGNETNSKIIDLTKSKIFMLGKATSSDSDTQNTFKFISRVNIQDFIKNKDVDYIRFRLYIVDSFTNMGKVYEQKYYKSAIKSGDFIIGDSLKIE
jgi:hypothetical protein